MLSVSDTASEEFGKVLDSQQATGKHLILFFQGFGWSGPSLGLALEESIEGLEKLQSNGINTYIDPRLKQMLQPLGNISIDYVTTPTGRGFTIRVGNDTCDTGGCSC